VAIETSAKRKHVFPEKENIKVKRDEKFDTQQSLSEHARRKNLFCCFHKEKNFSSPTQTRDGNPSENFFSVFFHNTFHPRLG
jgi:hypothetical protein